MGYWHTLRRWHATAAWAWALLVCVPMLAVVWAAFDAAWLDALAQAAWQDVIHTPHLLTSVGLTLWTGLAPSLLAWLLSAWLISVSFGTRAWTHATRWLAPMLAVPHAAFAIGLVLLIAPSGWIARILSHGLTAWTEPPAIITAQDPWGLSLIVMLAAKEIPFLLWAAATQLQRDDARVRWLRESQAAQSLGYSARQAFARVVWPQLAPRLLWPFAAVVAYSLTVVDVALIIGPGNPSTLAVLAWQYLQDADAHANVQGAQLSWLLALGVTVVVAATWALMRAAARSRSHRWMGVRRRSPAYAAYAAMGLSVLPVFYGAVLLALVIGSITGLWPFPSLWPSLTVAAWHNVAGSGHAVATTLMLAAISSGLALMWCLVWLELTSTVLSTRHDAWARPLLYIPLLLPGVLWVVGLHRMALHLSLGASWGALIFAHTLAGLPYVLIALSPAYLGFDRRYAHICASLGQSYLRYLLHVKLPMLRAAIAASAAVGVAVSVAQFLPTMYLGEGRFVTITTEAVTLSSGGQRSLVAAYAWLQWLMPAMTFAWATWTGRHRFARMAS